MKGMISVSFILLIYHVLVCSVVVQGHPTCLSKDDLSDLLFQNKWRTKEELKKMSDDDQRNTVIVEINKMTGHTIQDLQGRSSIGGGRTLGALTAIANMAAIIRNYDIRSSSQLKNMRYEPDLRNTLIVEINKRFSITIGELQGMNDQTLLNTFCINI